MSQEHQNVTNNEAIVTVNGPVPAGEVGVTDAHNHLWIAPVDGTAPGLPQLFNRSGITAELVDYRATGGSAQVDCQPGGCGRDANVLADLSRASGVHVVTSTGFHLKMYYPPDAWLWSAGVDQARDYFINEIRIGTQETLDLERPVRAGCIKIACEDTLAQSPANLLEAAAGACLETGVAILIHTQRGSDVEDIITFFQDFGVAGDRLVVCHVDKRPDFGLHRELAQLGVMLEYDTFYRTKYQPDQNVWPLLEKMVGAGLEGRVVLGTDMAEAIFWKRLGGKPGLIGLTQLIIPRMQQIGFTPVTISRLTGRNIVRVLVPHSRQTAG